MPGQNRQPRFALSAAFDARTWTGTNVLNWNGTAGFNVALPTYAAGEGVFESALAFLCGHGSYNGGTPTTRRDLQGLINTASSAAGGNTSWVVSLNTSDRVVLTNSAYTFNVDSTDQAASFGFSNTGAGNPSGAGGVLTAASDWTRGIVANWALKINVTAGWAGSFTAGPANDYYSTDLPILMRARGAIADADDVWNTGNIVSLEQRLNLAGRIDDRIGINQNGHVFVTWQDFLNRGSLTWPSATFRNRLGFDGTTGETALFGGTTHYRAIANNPLPGFLVPTRPLGSITLVRTNDGAQAVRLGDGTMHSFRPMTFPVYEMDFWLGGSVASVDEHRHFLDHFLRYAEVGQRCTLFQEWGDSRRAIDNRTINSYSLLQTTEYNGYRGRLRLHRDLRDRQFEHAARWENDLRLRHRVMMALAGEAD